MTGSKLSKNFKTVAEATVFANVLKENPNLLFLSIQHTLVEAFFSIDPNEMKAPGLNIFACQELYRPHPSINQGVSFGEPLMTSSFNMNKWP